MNYVSICLKFEFKQEVYLIYHGCVFSGTIDGYDIFNKLYIVFISELGIGRVRYFEEELFATYVEAKIKLHEV